MTTKNSLTDHRHLLNIAFLSVFDSCRSDAEKFKIMYDNLPLITKADIRVLPSCNSNQYDYGLFVDEKQSPTSIITMMMFMTNIYYMKLNDFLMSE